MSETIDDEPRQPRRSYAEAHERLAWEAFIRARHDWQQREAPSVGARARAIVRSWPFNPSETRDIEAALDQYLAPWQKVEHGDKGRQQRRTWDPV